FLGRSLFLDPALVHEYHTVGNFEGEFHLMGDQQHGHAFSGEVLDDGYHLIHQLRRSEHDALPISWFMNTTRSETSKANFISWVTSSMVMPSVARSWMTDNTSFTSSGSRAEVTSSNSMTLGFMATARAMA